MSIVITKESRKQKAIRLNEDEADDLRMVAKSILRTTDSKAVVIIFSAIAKEYRKNKDIKELNIKIKLE
jgi:hypothetical protein